MNEVYVISIEWDMKGDYGYEIILSQIQKV